MPLRYDQRPIDHTPLRTADLPDLPTRDRNIPATAWHEAPAALLALGDDLADAPVAHFKRRIGPWLLWRAGPATKANAHYWACRADDLTVQHRFSLYADGGGAGVGPSGDEHDSFRNWKIDLKNSG